MSDFEIPPLPEIEKTWERNGIRFDFPEAYIRGLYAMRDQLAPHQLAAKRMFEALNWISADKLDLEIVKISDRDVLREVIKMIHLTAKEALADVQKIYEQASFLMALKQFTAHRK